MRLLGGGSKLGGMRIERLATLADAPSVLRAVAAAATRAGLPRPAALIGDWFGARAVIAPSLMTEPVAAASAFPLTPGHTAGPAIGGGWFGYLAYPDAGADGVAPRIPEAAGGWSDCVLRQDAAGQWWYESLTDTALPAWLAELPTQQASRYALHWVPPDRDVHRHGVLACLDAIAAGEVYQACVCTRFTGHLDGDPLEFFADAAARTVPSRAAYLAGEWGAVASLSPELFLRRRGTDVTSSPIKGTLPRSADPAGLLASVKDVAENIMIVDLVRNDLGRVAATGTVTVPELLVVQPAPGVWHLVSTVAAEVPAELPMDQLLQATFPPASVTGTPKTRARQLLRQWEPARRGVYCGTVGLASPMAGCELNVAIRTVEFGGDGSAVLGVGGGITADSDPDREWEECLHKAAPIVALSGAASAPGPQNGVVQLTP